ncbi:glycosyltransferase [Alcaligenes faecalis]|uniref:glycosyltransferase family protein n=1 Tax=Alcaligenes faecalis TaxID=511 RepID=UPI0024BCF3F5|nr:glycosyltransferase [Alcaligenes faecalis]WHQ42631.1 glycosyltransferase family 4 protein [Alcaligenes faecalis]
MSKRVLVCGSPDLNFIDGSSIWAQTIALALAATGQAEVDFLAKSKPEREELFAPLRSADQLTIVDGTAPNYWNGKGFKRLSLPMMAELAVKLDQANTYDVVVVRGLDIAATLLEHPAVLKKCWLYLTDIPQQLDEYTAELRERMSRLAMGCQRLLCQTQGFVRLWQELVPNVGLDKFSLYTPVIPDLPDNLIPLNQRSMRAVYAGKFKADWMTLEMAEQWPEIHQQVPGSELIMIGDKIHHEAGWPEYKARMQQALERTAGLQWLGAQSRESVQAQLRSARVGLSWRAESMNDTVEYSTKILEYGGAGCAAILNRNTLHEQLLGVDYPLFANSAEEFSRQLRRAFQEPAVAEAAANALTQLARRHTFSQRVKEIQTWLQGAPEIKAVNGKLRVLVAGHDLKFFALLQDALESTGQFEFLVDTWAGHDKHDERRSFELLEQADIIFCEWCLGNLKWYSNNKKPHQRLVARFHAQERTLPYVAESNWDNIDHISYVSEFIRKEGQSVFGFPDEKTSVIPNLLDKNKFTPLRKTGDALFTLGMIGVSPSLKRLDRAIDLLEALLKEDSRYCLRVKGRNPLEYDWLLKRDEELQYYKNIYSRINSNPQLQYKLIFDPPGDDVNDWLSLVGYIISASDFESFHMAIGEAMLTGSIPIIWNWEGAAEIWGREFIVDSVEEAKNRVLSSNEYSALELIEKLEKYSSVNVSRSWGQLLG